MKNICIFGVVNLTVDNMTINKGFSHSSGEIMAWLNSDDMYPSLGIKTVVSIMSDLPQVELTTSNPAFGTGNFLANLKSCLAIQKKHFRWFYLPLSKKYRLYTARIYFWRQSLWQKVGRYVLTDFKLVT